MSEITRVGVDLAKNVIQVHAVDAAGRVVAARALPRSKFIEWCVHLPAGCSVTMEACGGAHHWARRLTALGLQVKLIAPQFVTPYRLQGKSGKNDANDAAAVCEAASRPTMHFVPIKTAAQQGKLAIHRMREGYKSEYTAWVNRIRGILAEFGLVAALSPDKLKRSLPELLEDAGNELPGEVRVMVQDAMAHCASLQENIKSCEQKIAQHAKEDERVQRAAQLWGIGPITASAVVASVCDFRQFKNAAQFAAWLGLTPSQNSSGGKAKLGKITKRGDTYLRMLLVQGAKAALLTGTRRSDRIADWARALACRSGWQRACVALASKNARILWAMFTRGVAFDPAHVSVKPT
ncbi:MAG TPA: IS110 family transposase [Ramlibacter sp.]|nr:IS110 family transposase [Ramlibacter sp.]